MRCFFVCLFLCVIFVVLFLVVVVLGGGMTRNPVACLRSVQKERKKKKDKLIY